MKEDQVKAFTDVGRMYAQLYVLYSAPGSAISPVAGEVEAFAREAGYLTIKWLHVPAGENREESRSKAERLFSSLNGAADPARIFSEISPQDGVETGEETFLPGESTLSTEMEQAAAALNEEQCSGILETDAGFWLLYRSCADTEALAERYFDHLLQSAADTAEVSVTKAFDALDTVAFFAAMEQQGV